MRSRSGNKAHSSRPGTSSSPARPLPGVAVSVRTDEQRLYVTLDDGREVSAPLTDRLRTATAQQRASWTIEGFGTAIHWEEIDEDVGVNYAIGISEDEVAEYAGFTFYDAAGRPIRRRVRGG